MTETVENRQDGGRLVATPVIAGALRARLVARLAGVTLRQLGYWHRTGLIQAKVIPGAPGRPRLYSWTDYVKVRAITKLLRQGLSTRKIRAAIAFLDHHVPDWYNCPLYGLGARVIVEIEGCAMTADEQQQLLLPSLVNVVREIEEEGPLGELREFAKVVDMRPGVAGGNPVLRGTRIETDFVATLVSHGSPVSEIARVYRVNEGAVERAVQFQHKAA